MSNYTINIGLEHSFKILAAADIHLNDCDERDSEKLLALSEKRKLVYPNGKTTLARAFEMSEAEKLPLFILGDMTDFVSEANLDNIRKITAENDFTFLAGNHDFRPMGGMKYDVPESRELNFERVNSCYNNNILFFSKVINGVNFVGLDNFYYRFTYEQIKLLKNEESKGFPIILMLHIPLFEDSIFHTIVRPGRDYASIVNVPAGMMSGYPEDRFIQQIADEPTKEMCSYITGCQNIKAVITGHLHKSFSVTLENDLPQFTVGKEEISEFTIL